jgi:hypothetical protein
MRSWRPSRGSSGVGGARAVTDPLPEAKALWGMPPGGDRITARAGTGLADRRAVLVRACRSVSLRRRAGPALWERRARIAIGKEDRDPAATRAARGAAPAAARLAADAHGVMVSRRKRECRNHTNAIARSRRLRAAVSARERRWSSVAPEGKDATSRSGATASAGCCGCWRSDPPDANRRRVTGRRPAGGSA